MSSDFFVTYLSRPVKRGLPPFHGQLSEELLPLLLPLASFPRTGGVPALDGIKASRSYLGSRLVRSPSHPFPLKKAEETFRRSVVRTTTLMLTLQGTCWAARTCRYSSEET